MNLSTSTPTPLTPRRAPSTASSTQRLFRAMNRVMVPLVRCGVGSPIAGPGLVVLETTGRKTGRPRRVPLVGPRAGRSVIVSTVRTNSAWVRNLEDHSGAEVWSGGRARPATATVRRLPTGANVCLRMGERPRSVSWPASVDG